MLSWEALAFDGEVPEEVRRREYYADKTAAMAAGQESGTIVGDIDATHLTLFVLSIAGWWSTVPQVKCFGARKRQPTTSGTPRPSRTGSALT